MLKKRRIFKSLIGLLCLLSFTLFGKNKSDFGGIVKPNVYIISIGLNDYSSIRFQGDVQFQNSESDASSFSDSISSYAEKWYNFGRDVSTKQVSRVFKYGIYGNNVTWKNIQATIDSVSIKAEPDDYFFFMFSGLSLQTIEGTFFIPYIADKSNILINSYETVKDSSSLTFIKKQGFSLKQLAERLELIPARNQLIISEAGASSDFSREMVSILRSSNSNIHQLSERNRVIIVPTIIGLDPGPIANWITEMPFPRINIFDLFSEKKWVDVLKYFYDKDDDNYATIFFESQFFKQLNDLNKTINRGLPSATSKPDKKNQ